jgi:hypothetical protein
MVALACLEANAYYDHMSSQYGLFTCMCAQLNKFDACA